MTAMRIDKNSPMGAGWPLTRFSTPGGRPAPSSRLASTMALIGVSSLGRPMTVQPAASAADHALNRRESRISTIGGVVARS